MNGQNKLIDFDGSQTWVDASSGNGSKVNFTSLNLPRKSITIEAWVKPKRFQKWQSIVSFIQDNGSFEKGWSLEMADNEKVQFALKSTSSNSLTYLPSNSQFNVSEWLHVAATYDGGSMKLYVNGILEAESNAQNGDIDYADSWLSIGSYKDDNENNRFYGSVDELRIWDTVRSIEQIQANMCRFIDENSDHLIHYYDFDSEDLQNQVDGAQNSVLFNGGQVENHIMTSGAPIGQSSFVIQEQSILAIHDLYANLSVENSSMNKIYTYIQNGTKIAGIDLEDLNMQTHFGFFMPNPSGNIEIEFSYLENDSLARDQLYQIVNRNNLTSSIYQITNSNQDTVLGTINTQISNSQELTFMQKSANLCNFPDSINWISSKYNNLTIDWNGGEAEQWVCYVLESGLEIGASQSERLINEPRLILDTLKANTLYNFYVQSRCVDGESLFVGPITMKTKTCENPSKIEHNEVYGNSIQFNWEEQEEVEFQIEWGNSGFSKGFGIVKNLDTAYTVMKGLLPLTSYDFYFRSVCGTSFSSWIGPISIETTDEYAVGFEKNDFETAIYRIGNNDIFIMADQDLVVKLYSLAGIMIMERKLFKGEKVTILHSELVLYKIEKSDRILTGKL